MAEGKISKENRRHLKNEIESLLTNISSSNNEDLLIDTELADELATGSEYDFEEMSSTFTDQARSITDSLLKNFVDIGIFEESDYAKHKKELDTINISNFMFQLKTIKVALIKVMEEIAGGNTHPRLLEVMGGLQDKMANITKMQANYVLFLEETYKKLNVDTPVNSNNTEVNSSPNEGQYFVSVGTKNIINQLPDVNEGIENDESSNLVDPTNKLALLKNTDINVEIEGNTDDDEFIDLTEII
tara:strand:- start:660 stop:1391 length:732 start_codon:yes stop_codon:yes gene_type:complete